MRKILGTLALAAWLAACQTAPDKAAAHGHGTANVDPDLDEASNDLEESKSDYEACLREQEDDAELDCEASKEMYEEDQAAYDALLKKKKAQH
ncbi:hypothetical protein [Methylomagnum ishizawai]|uniref:hypothetical protein n=1 Tax=Methylomagnum ishizawai TaxID=1760988 RepID=UPI001C320FD7|nr:hypothetical protein [Methylomagnum ishizawai]BBL76252.1 hypothetical protein MishRS11D_33500 [Methylomagnum ishizawai]